MSLSHERAVNPAFSLCEVLPDLWRVIQANMNKAKCHPARNSRQVIKTPIPSGPEKAQIAIEGADHLYREIRITNTLTRENGDEVSLKPGAQVEVTVRGALS